MAGKKKRKSAKRAPKIPEVMISESDQTSIDNALQKTFESAAEEALGHIARLAGVSPSRRDSYFEEDLFGAMDQYRGMKAAQTLMENDSLSTVVSKHLKLVDPGEPKKMGSHDQVQQQAQARAARDEDD